MIAESEKIVRCRYIQFMQLFSKQKLKQFGGVDWQTQLSQLELLTDMSQGIISLSPSYIERFAAAQLQFLALSSGVREKTIGYFIRENEYLLKNALGCKSVRSEVSLRWIEHDGNIDEVAIRPDILIEREDGRFDIGDLKLALLDRRSLTRGGSSRRRFVDSIQEGIAQLANYEDYFKYKRNQSHALEEFGICVDEPNLYLIVGSWKIHSKPK